MSQLPLKGQGNTMPSGSWSTLFKHFAMRLQLDGYTLINTSLDNDLLPQLSPDHSTSSLDTEETPLLDGICPYDILSPRPLIEELDSKTGNAPTGDDKNLFSRYLRSPSPLYFHAEDNGGNIDNHIRLLSPTITPKEFCFPAERTLQPAGPMDKGTLKSKTYQIQAKTPRITLRVRQPMPAPKPAPTPKVHLRLSQPKRALVSTPVRRGAPHRQKNGFDRVFYQSPRL